MGLLETLRRKSSNPHDALRKHLRHEFEDVAIKAIQDYGDNELIGGMMVQAAIGNFYKGMKEADSVLICSATYAVTQEDYLKILEEECKRTLKKYLEI